MFDTIPFRKFSSVQQGKWVHSPHRTDLSVTVNRPGQSTLLIKFTWKIQDLERLPFARGETCKAYLKYPTVGLKYFPVDGTPKKKIQLSFSTPQDFTRFVDSLRVWGIEVKEMGGGAMDLPTGSQVGSQAGCQFGSQIGNQFTQWNAPTVNPWTQVPFPQTMTPAGVVGANPVAQNFGYPVNLRSQVNFSQPVQLSQLSQFSQSLQTPDTSVQEEMTSKDIVAHLQKRLNDRKFVEMVSRLVSST